MNIPIENLINIFTKTKEIVSNNMNIPMCHALVSAIKNEPYYKGIDSLRVHEIKDYLIDTYLLDFKPKYLDRRDCWFDYDVIGQGTRINILNTVLHIIKYKNCYIELADDYRTENDFFPKGTILIETSGGYMLRNLKFNIEQIEENKTGLFKRVLKHRKELNINIGYIMGSEITPKCVEVLLNKEFNIECKVKKIN